MQIGPLWLTEIDTDEEDDFSYVFDICEFRSGFANIELPSW